MTDVLKTGDGIVNSSQAVHSEERLVQDIYKITHETKEPASVQQEQFTQKIQNLDVAAHQKGGLLEGKTDVHITGISNGQLLLIHKNDGARFPHHTYLVNHDGVIVRSQALDEHTGRPFISHGKEKHSDVHVVGGSALLRRWGVAGDDAELKKKFDSMLETTPKHTTRDDFLRKIDARITLVNSLPPSMRRELTGFSEPVDSRLVASELISGKLEGSKYKLLVDEPPVHKNLEERTKELLHKENMRLEAGSVQIQHIETVRKASLENLTDDLKNARIDLQSNDVMVFKHVEQQAGAITETLGQCRQRAELMQLSLDNFEHRRLVNGGNQLAADKLSAKMLQEHGSEVLKVLSPEVWHDLRQKDGSGHTALERLNDAGLTRFKRLADELGEPHERFKRGLQALGEIPVPRDQPWASEKLTARHNDVNAFRTNALRAIDNEPAIANIERTAFALNHNLSDLALMAKAGSQGTKGQDFVDMARDKAKEIQKTLTNIPPQEIVDLRLRLHEMNATLKTVTEDTAKNELQKRITAVSAMIDVCDPESKMRRDVDGLCKYVIERDFDKDSLEKWVKTQLPVLAVSVVAAAGATALVVGSMGTASPLALGLASAAAGSTGWLTGSEVTKESLYSLNSHWDTGMGSLNERSLVGVWIGTDEEKRDFCSQVLKPYSKDIAINTTMALATMGVVTLTKVGGKFLATTIGGADVSGAALTQLASDSRCQEFVVRSQQLEEVAAKNPASQKFLRQWLNETKSFAGFTAAQEGLDGLAKQCGELNPQMSVGLTIGLAMAHGHLKSGDVHVEKGGRLFVTPEKLSDVAKVLRSGGCEVHDLPNGDLYVKSPGEIGTILRVTGAHGDWPTIGEHKSSDVVTQPTPKGCVGACGEMLAKGGLNLTQKEIRSQLPERANVYSLAKVLKGDWVWGTETSGGPEKVLADAQKVGKPWAVELNSIPPAGDFHMVVVDKFDSAKKLVSIRDPWNGTRYDMNLKDFLKHWKTSGYSWIREIPKGH